MTENKDKWKKYVHGVVSPRIEDEQNREWNGRNNNNNNDRLTAFDPGQPG